jgi:hypothetical protein
VGREQGASAPAVDRCARAAWPPLTIGVVELVALVPLVIGVGIGVVGLLGWFERLPRNRFGGVRTPATLRSDDAFRIANKVAGLPIAVAGLAGVVGGLLGFFTGLVVTIVGFVGMVAIAVAGGILGHRAAEAVPEPAPALPEGCKGCACGGCEIATAVKRSVGADVAGVRGE